MKNTFPNIHLLKSQRHGSSRVMKVGLVLQLWHAGAVTSALSRRFCKCHALTRRTCKRCCRNLMQLAFCCVTIQLLTWKLHFWWLTMTKKISYHTNDQWFNEYEANNAKGLISQISLDRRYIAYKQKHTCRWRRDLCLALKNLLDTALYCECWAAFVAATAV